ncbi:hypothetical protein ACTOWA_20800 [Herbaspirillum seropedicae]|uniref:hypothetical protein n=1 Tax=Herbaspirillum seropedicae TaxID=964 RepID=UPI003F8D0974
MDNAWGVINAVISAGAGLIGMRWGAGLTARRELDKEAKQEKKDAIYLAIIVGSYLEDFANACVAVMYDDGTEYGRPADAESGYHQATVPTPAIDPLSLDVNWKTLQPDLMDEILSLPYRTERLKQKLSAVNENDLPPDFAETFWERQYGYACLAQDVAKMASRLRTSVGLPSLPHSDDKWDRRQQIEERIKDLEERRDSQPLRPAPIFE